MQSINATPLPPTAATLLKTLDGDGRTAMTVLTADLHVCRMLQLVTTFLGFEPGMHHLFQVASPKTIAHLGVAIDLWMSGSRTACKVVSASQMSMGSLVVACLTPMALEQDLMETDASTQVSAATFGLTSSLVYSVVARQHPEEFEQAASVAQFRSIPIAAAYEQQTGNSLRHAASKIVDAWGLPGAFRLALTGGDGMQVTAAEKMMLNAVEIATAAAQSVGVSVEPWPYMSKMDRIEQIALIQALGMRAKRTSARLAEELEKLNAA